MAIIGRFKIGMASRHARNGIVAALLMVFALAASYAAADQLTGNMTASSNESGGPGPPGLGAGEIPEGAIPAGEELYMVPAGIDREGCAQFTAWSPTKPVLQIIYYRDRNGAFTTDRAKADCGKN